MEYTFTARLWQWHGEGAAWMFITVPEDIADEVEDMQVGPRRGFGAVKVRVSAGGSTWDTSMFPSKDQASFILPVKGAVRKAESLDAGDEADFSITLIDSS